MEKQVTKRAMPEWIMDAKGNKKQLEKARWNMDRVQQVFTDDPEHAFDMGELARLIYGHNGKKNRDNVRKHIPMQRNHMMARMVPIVTRYGPRGIIVSVKLYNRELLEDRRSMLEELDRLRSRKELTEERYGTLCNVLGIGELSEVSDDSA